MCSGWGRCRRLLCVGGAVASWGATEAPENLLCGRRGGQSTLFVTPEGQSLLIDTGWPGNAGRDADRIVAAAKKAGLSKIDFVLLTHYHVDHAGGVPQLFAKIPVGAFIDHGANREPGDRETEQSWEAYQKLVSSQHVNHRESGRCPAYRGITRGGREF